MSLLFALVTSLLFLLLFADLVVRGAVSIAMKFGVPPLLIGLTIVAFGTSAPELVISVQAAIDGLPGIALGNVVGSNVANVFLVLGVPAMFYPIATSQPGIRRNTFLMLASSVLFVVLCFKGQLVFEHGLLLFGLIIAFLVYSGIRVVRGRNKNPAAEQLIDPDGVGGLLKSNVAIGATLVIGLGGLPIASHFLVDSAEQLARIAGISESVIGLSLIAFGTSLPELATAIAAAMRRQSAMVMGNVIGSNLFNLLAVMGVAAMITDIPVTPEFLDFNLWVMLLAAFVVARYTFAGAPIGRISGIILTISYLVFIYANFA